MKALALMLTAAVLVAACNSHATAPARPQAPGIPLCDTLPQPVTQACVSGPGDPPPPPHP